MRAKPHFELTLLHNKMQSICKPLETIPIKQQQQEAKSVAFHAQSASLLASYLDCSTQFGLCNLQFTTCNFDEWAAN